MKRQRDERWKTQRGTKTVGEQREGSEGENHRETNIWLKSTGIWVCIPTIDGERLV